jgi:hypothetical protein
MRAIPHPSHQRRPLPTIPTRERAVPLRRVRRLVCLATDHTHPRLEHWPAPLRVDLLPVPCAPRPRRRARTLQAPARQPIRHPPIPPEPGHRQLTPAMRTPLHHRHTAAARPIRLRFARVRVMPLIPPRRQELHTAPSAQAWLDHQPPRHPPHAAIRIEAHRIPVEIAVPAPAILVVVADPAGIPHLDDAALGQQRIPATVRR